MEDNRLINLNSEADRLEVWKKGIVVEGYNPDHYRKDCCGAWMAYDKYGDTSNPYGWQIDHVYPRSRGGEEHFANLRPMHWRNNLSKGDDYPSYYGSVKSEGNKNVDSNDEYTVNDRLRSRLKQLYGDIEG